MIIKELFNREKNDKWLMHKFDGSYDYKNSEDNNLYFKFEYDKKHNEEIINDF